MDPRADPLASATTDDEPARVRAIAREAVRTALVAVVVSRIVAMGVAWAAAWLLASGTGGLEEGFAEIWRRWDARHILGIAEHGYSAPQSDPHATEWWPGFPLLVRAVMLTGLGPTVAGLLVSAAASFVAFTYLYRLAEEEIGPGAGTRAVVLLAVFPTAVFLIAPYTEGLFLAGAITAFYYARRDRWPLVALPAAAAMSARLPGAFVLVGLAVEFLRRWDFSLRRTLQAAAALAVGTLPFFGYTFFLWQARDNPLYFVVDAEEGWNRHFVGPWRSLVNTWNIDFATAPTNWLFAWRVEILASALMVVLVVWALAKREWGYAAFMGSLGFVLLSTTWYFSHPRMLLMFFPAVLFLTGLTQRRPGLHQALVPAMAIVAALGIVVFTRGAWFF